MLQSLAQLFLKGPDKAFIDVLEKTHNSYLPNSPEAAALSLILGDSFRCFNDLKMALSYYTRASMQQSVNAEMRIEAIQRYMFLTQKVMDAYAKEMHVLTRLPPTANESAYLPLPSLDGVALKDRFYILESIKTDLLCNNRHFKSQSILPLLNTIERLLSREKNLRQYISEGRRVCVIGDIHGTASDMLSFYDLCILKEVQLQCFQLLDPNSTALETFQTELSSVFVFLGDYVDRGHNGFGPLLFIYILKSLYPRSIILLRGNHECDSLNQIYGFKEEMYRIYGSKNGIYDAVQRTFAAMPYFCRLVYVPHSTYQALEVLQARVPKLAVSANKARQSAMRLASYIEYLFDRFAESLQEQTYAQTRNLSENEAQELQALHQLVDNTTITMFFCHGGPPCVYTECMRRGETYIDIDSFDNILQRSIAIIDPLASELTWNDPAPEPLSNTLYSPSPRRLGYKYSYELLKTWCNNTGVDIVFRGHEVAFQGLRQDFQYALDLKQLGGPNQEMEYWLTRSALRENPRQFTVFSSSSYENLSNHGAACIIQFEPPSDGVDPRLTLRCFFLS